MDEPPRERIALATEILTKYGSVRHNTITAEQVERLRSLAASDEERTMALDDLAAQVIQREVRFIRESTGS